MKIKCQKDKEGSGWRIIINEEVVLCGLPQAGACRLYCLIRDELIGNESRLNAYRKGQT